MRAVGHAGWMHKLFSPSMTTTPGTVRSQMMRLIKASASPPTLHVQPSRFYRTHLPACQSTSAICSACSSNSQLQSDAACTCKQKHQRQKAWLICAWHACNIKPTEVLSIPAIEKTTAMRASQFDNVVVVQHTSSRHFQKQVFAEAAGPR